MVRQVRGTGTLVPEDTRWIPATTAGRVERILLRSGADVEPDTVIVELGSPELEQSVVEARLQLESALAQLTNRRAELDSALLTQRASAANMESEARQAELQAQADEALAKEGLQGAIVAKKNRARADDLAEPDQDRAAAPGPGRDGRSNPSSPCRNPRSSRLRTTYAAAPGTARKAEDPGRHQGQAAGRPGRGRLAAGRRRQRRPCRRPRAPEGRTADSRNPDPRHRDRADRLDRHTERHRPGTRLTHRRRGHQRNRDGRRPTDGRAPTRGEARPDGGRHGGARTPRQRGQRGPRRLRPGEQHDVALQGHRRGARSRRWTARRPAPR